MTGLVRRIVWRWRARRNPPAVSVVERVEEWTDPLDMYPDQEQRS